MKPILAFLRGLTRHPRTSAVGIAVVAGVTIRAVAAPEILADPTVWLALLSALGLLAAADGRGDGGAAPPRIPAGYGGRGASYKDGPH